MSDLNWLCPRCGDEDAYFQEDGCFDCVMDDLPLLTPQDFADRFGDPEDWPPPPCRLLREKCTRHNRPVKRLIAPL